MHRLRPYVYKSWLQGGNDNAPRNPRQAMRDVNRVNGDRRIGRRNVINDPGIHAAFDPNAGELQNLEPNQNYENLNAAVLENLERNQNNDNLDPNVVQEQFNVPVEEAANDAEEEVQNGNQCECHFCQDKDDPAEEFVFKETQSYAEKHNFNSQLHPELQVTKFEVFVMVLTLAMRHGFTGPLITDLLGFVNKIIGRDAMPESYHIFKKLFSVDSSLSYHFICEHCNLYLGKYGEFASQEISCPNCDKICNVNPHSLQNSSFFVTLSIKNQMQDLVNRANQYFMPRAREANENVSDICDGELYKSLCAEGKPLSNPLSLTLTISTDGGQVFETSRDKNSLWPIQVICNELEPGERYRAENMMLAGIWFGTNAPPMSAFFKPLADELKDMETSGVKRILSDGQEVLCPVYVLLCVCDSVAKPKIQNIAQFNAYYGCGYCLQKGKFIEECSQVRYPYDGRTYQLRSHQSMKEAMMLADATEQNEMGVKGLSPLLHFSTVHLVFGIPIDWMHACLLGTMRRLVGLWLDESSNTKRYYIKKHENELDKRLAGITAPSKLVTRPKLISKRSSWKAKDWLAFLLFFGVVVLEGLLPDVYLSNFKDLSSGIFLLLKESIRPIDFNNSDVYLKRFLLNFNGLYGTVNMVYNLHLISHLIKVVRMTGPLQMYAAFSFENGIGLLIDMVKGTNSVAPQICRKYLAAVSLPYILSFHEIAQPIQEFCESILTYKRNKHSIKVNGITLLGGEKLHVLSPEEHQLLQDSGYLTREIVTTFNRAIFKKQVITSTNYKRPTKTNDTCIQLVSGKFGIVDLIWLRDTLDDALMFVRPLTVCEGFEAAAHIFTCAGDPYEKQVIIPFLQIKRKGIFYSVEGRRYVTFRPNVVERE